MTPSGKARHGYQRFSREGFTGKPYQAVAPTRSRSSTITVGRTALAEQRIPPVHPGEVLLEEFLKPMGLSQYRLAKALGVPPQRIGDIVHGRRAVTADTALRLGRFFNMEAQFWLNLQARHDLEVAAEALEGRLEREVQPLGA